MKQLILNFCMLVLIIILMLLGAQAQQPEVHLGAGLLQAPKSSYYGNSKGGQLGLFIPFLSKRSIDFGAQASAAYYFSDKLSGAKNNPFALKGIDQSYVSIPESGQGHKQQLTQLLLGPRVDFKLSDNVRLSTSVEGGLALQKQDGIQEVQYMELSRTMEKVIYEREAMDAKSFLLLPRLRLNYDLGRRFGLWVEGNYSFGKKEWSERQIQAVNAEGVAIENVEQFMAAEYTTATRKENWTALGAQAGLRYRFGGNKKADRPTKETATRGNSPVLTNTTLSVKEKKSEERRLLVARSPKNNSSFRSGKEVRELTWLLRGPAIPGPQYSVELTRVQANQSSQRSYYAMSEKTTVSIEALTKGEALPDGQYRWQVKGVGTGLTSSVQYFNISQCQIQFSIENDTISCLGYEGEQRKYRICFTTVYQSSSGNLTYAQSGSGLTIFDQSYNPLSYTFVGSPTQLQTQIGATSSSQQYCVEVLVPSSVTSIGIGIQGDDLDPGPILCQPGVSTVLDSLPDCLCKDCDNMVFNFGQEQVAAAAGQNNVYNIQGNVQVNQPIYGMEVQVLSYQYSATPSPCSGGVTSVEESGMLLRNGTSINGASNVQFFNSNGDPANNTNASRIIKYLSNTAMTGNIPVQFAIGLPGPLAGFDANCCKIRYEVCLRFVIYYDAGSCKSCVFTKCFQFTN